MTTAPPSNAPWYLGKKLPPLGLMYVAAALEKAGFPVQMLDNYLQKQSTKEVKQLVLKLNPEIVGITCGSATYRKCLETAKAIKEVLPTCKIVVGGWHASYMPDSLLETAEIDYVVMGEGEKAMTELAAYLMKGDELGAAGVAGVACRHNGQNVKNSPKFMSNMDEIPYPARHLLPLEKYDRTIEFLKAKPADVMSIARGCTFNCGFCETKKLWGNICRAFSPQRVIDEMQDLANKYGTKGIYFINDNFTLRKKETVELCDLIIKNKLDLEWVCDTRVDLVTQELLEKMKSAGCKAIWFGVESGSQRILDRINRHITLEQTENTFKLCKKVGIQVACSFMLGMPGETREDLQASFKFAEKLDADWCQFNIFIAYPDSKLYQEMLQTNSYTSLDDFLQKMTINDVSKLFDGRVQYSAMCYDDGGIVDDLLVYHCGDHYMLVVNASNTKKDFDWLKSHLEGDVELIDRSDEFSLLAVQGPQSIATLKKISDIDLSAIEYYHFKRGRLAGEEMIISRTGYTGELGFELYFRWDETAGRKVWDAVFNAGKEFGIVPIGLGARDTLRLEMGYCLYGNDIDQTTHPLEAGLGWITKMNKSDFVGKSVMKKAKAEGLRRKLVGFTLSEKAVARHGYPLTVKGSEVGHVTSGTFSPSLERAIGLGYVSVGNDEEGSTIHVGIRGKEVPATIVKIPFVNNS